MIFNLEGMDVRIGRSYLFDSLIINRKNIVAESQRWRNNGQGAA